MTGLLRVVAPGAGGMTAEAGGAGGPRAGPTFAEAKRWARIGTSFGGRRRSRSH
ncbi:MAG: hypothetical protein R3C97_13305 [Geminicoccaceae bacterium]